MESRGTTTYRNDCVSHFVYTRHSPNPVDSSRGKKVNNYDNSTASVIIIKRTGNYRATHPGKSERLPIVSTSGTAHDIVRPTYFSLQNLKCTHTNTYTHTAIIKKQQMNTEYFDLSVTFNVADYIKNHRRYVSHEQ